MTVPRTGGIDGNEAMTAITALVLTALLLAEGVTIVFMGGLRVEHMFIGVVLLGPVAVKLASTGYRFLRYYTGAANYRAKGPPALGLRLMGPVLVVFTVLVFATGVALLLAGHRSDALLTLQKVSFIVWGACFGIHFLWHLPGAWGAATPRRSRTPRRAVAPPRPQRVAGRRGDPRTRPPVGDAGVAWRPPPSRLTSARRCAS